MTETSNDVLAAFVDTNIWLYAFIQTQDSRKNLAAHELLASINPIVSDQVINEICVNLLKKACVAEHEVKELIKAFYAKYHVVTVDKDILVQASDLRMRYGLSFWDSTIVSSALQAGCSLLYTEDMQHGLMVENMMTLCNPFV
jgi:predicted nucleic acid-binding protein